MWYVLVVFAPEAILDTLVRLDIINGIVLEALLDSRSRVTSSWKSEIIWYNLDRQFVLIRSYWVCTYLRVYV